MYIIINEVGLFALFGHVLFKFQTTAEYQTSKDASDGVPVLHVSNTVPIGGRHWLADRLQEQSNKATSS